ncbi:MAG: hypothetical protein WAO74_02760 [Polaribacter sp.]|uniref:hypothetical protein n=1 Tax=Polaribacter sp. TaxID=1920175 RepID=UPI003BB18622
MKNILTFNLLFLSIITFSQEKSFLSKVTKENSVTTHSIKYAVNSIEDLKSINWDDAKEMFQKNKPEEIIELAFEINLPESKNKYNSSVKVGGKTENIDSLIKMIKKGVNVTTKIITENK